jgi:hypothetical protein
VGKNQDGRLEIFYIDINDTIYHNWQKDPNSDWHGDVKLSNIKAKQICVGKNQDGRLEIFYIGMIDTIYHNWQKDPNSDWNGEKQLGHQEILKVWMERYSPVIGHLPLNKLTLVCTHDTGSYDMDCLMCAPWYSCQHLNIENQLNLGVRVLDLRIGMQIDESGDERFIFIHDPHTTKTTLKNGLEQVRSFLEINKREVIILDFHQFKSLDSDNFDENELYKIVINTLGTDLIFPYQNKIPSLNEIYDTPHRVIVACNTENKLFSSFFKGVQQKWENVHDTDALRLSIETEMEKDHENCDLWSICAVITAYGLVTIHSFPELENWFKAGCEWAQRANIIAVNLVEETSIVPEAISECLLKGHNESSNL